MTIFPSLFSSEYYSMVTVPAGARSIYIQEMEASTSYLAARSLKRKYYLTRDWTVDWPGKFHFGGTVFDYQRSFNKPESLYAAGPTNETLVFEVSRCCWMLFTGFLAELLQIFFLMPGHGGLDEKKKKLRVIWTTRNL